MSNRSWLIVRPIVVGQSRNRRHLIGTSISKSFLVFYRLILFRFFFCWIATAKPIQAVTFVLFVPLFRPVAAGSLRQSCPAFSHRSRLPFRFVAAGSPRQSYPAYSSRSCLSFRPVVAGLLRQSCPAISYRSCLPFRLAVAGSLRQSCPAHYLRPSSNFRFVFFLLDRYGKTVQLKFAFVHNKLNRRYLFGASI